MELVRFLTAGSVDDGKSTLIGRLLYETRTLKSDQIDAVAKRSGADIDFALFTDGLKAEREQNITIDVSYQYFSSDQRRFIIADCPGHKEYTRNMITGASTADLLVLMVNIEHGILEQTNLHLKIAAFLAIPQVVVCVNKMDLVEYSQEKFQTLKTELLQQFDKDPLTFYFIPTCATEGDNIVSKSSNMLWYNGVPLLTFLNSFNPPENSKTYTKFPIQMVMQGDNGKAYLLGTVNGKALVVGEHVKVAGTENSAVITELYQFNRQLDRLEEGNYGTLVLDKNILLKRGDVLIPEMAQTTHTHSFEANLCWLNEASLSNEKRYLIKLGTTTVPCTIQPKSTETTVVLNTLFSAQITCEKGILAIPYKEDKKMGSFILIDPITNSTISCGTII